MTSDSGLPTSFRMGLALFWIAVIGAITDLCWAIYQLDALEQAMLASSAAQQPIWGWHMIAATVQHGIVISFACVLFRRAERLLNCMD
jgi:hypothetical protein